MPLCLSLQRAAKLKALHSTEVVWVVWVPLTELWTEPLPFPKAGESQIYSAHMEYWLLDIVPPNLGVKGWIPSPSRPQTGVHTSSNSRYVPALGTPWGSCLNCGPDCHQPWQNPSGNKAQNGMIRKFKIHPRAESQTPEQSLWASEPHPHYSTWQGFAWSSSHHSTPPFYTRQHRNHFCWTEAPIILLEPLHSVQVMQKNVPEQP